MKKVSVKQLAWAFAGCFLGAGFVSGQELWQFFGRFGIWGIAGIVVSMLMLSGLGYVIIRLSKLQNTEAVDMIIGGNWSLKYPLFSKLAGIFQVLFLVGIVIIMTACAGVLAKQLFNIPEWIASLFMTLVIVIIAITGISGVLSVFSFFVPLITVVTLVFAVISLILGADTGIASNTANNALLPNWFAAAVTYAAYNIFTSFGILASLGRFMETNKKSVSGLIMGALMLVVISVSILLSLNRFPSAVDDGLPMLAVASEISPVLGYIYGILLFGGLLGTSVSSIVAIGTQLNSKYEIVRKHQRISVAVIGLTSFVLSLIGFSELVGMVYPVLGYIGIVFIVVMLFNFAKLRGKL